MEKKELLLKIKKKFMKRIADDKKIHNAFLLVHSDKLDINLNIASGNVDNIHINQPYHIASIGKLFTSIVIGILYEGGKISYDDYITKYLSDDIISNLHIYKGVDYTSKIRIRHLLNHTSGLHDYFEERPKNGKSMIDEILDNPDKLWSPIEVINWSKNNFEAHFVPGDGFFYSDTGYHILGLIIEKITSKSLGDVFKDFIFEPLEMNQSFLYGYSNPIKPLKVEVAGLYVGDVNVMGYKSLGIDFAGGGIVSTNTDLLKFMKAIVNKKIISNDTFEKMADYSKFSIGIDYGYGLMNFTSIPIVFPKEYMMWGNAGSTGSYMFYNPQLDLYMIGSLNQFRYAQKGIRSLFSNIRLVSKYRKEKEKRGF